MHTLGSAARVLRAASLVTSAVLAGCAGQPATRTANVQHEDAALDRAVAQAATHDGRICRTEARVGSRVTTRVCRSAADIAEERIQARNAVAEARSIRGRVRAGPPRT